jgi:hypothetical protein
VGGAINVAGPATLGNTGIGVPYASESLKVQATGGQFCAYFLGSPSGQSNGLLIDAGIDSNDAGLIIRNKATTATLFKVGGDGAVNVKGSVNAGGKLTVNLNTSPLSTPLPTSVAQFGGPDGSNARVSIEAYGGAPAMDFRAASNTAASPAAVVTDQLIGLFTASGHNGSAFPAGASAAIQFKAGGAWTPSSTPSYVVLRTTPVGSTTPGDALRLGSDASVSAPGTIASTSPTTGTLTVGGGLGVAGNAFFGKPTEVQSADASTSVGGSAGQFTLNLRNPNTTDNNLTGLMFWQGVGQGGPNLSAAIMAQNTNHATGAANLNFYTSGLNQRMQIDASGGVIVGTPTGGSKGAGTINATALYDDNVLLTCFGTQHLKDGKVDLPRWDAESPTGRHTLAHKFVAMLESFDPRDPDQYIARMLRDEALPGMPTPTEWKHSAMSLGELHNRLWLAVELLASAFAGAVKKLEGVQS